jgi:hypothetical protein
MLDAFLEGNRRSWGGDSELSRALAARDVPIGIRSKLVEATLEAIVGRRLFGPRIAGVAPAIEMNPSSSGRLWIKHKNLFVTFVHKTSGVEPAGTEVLQALEDALVDWGPKYLPLVLSYARSAMARGGFMRELEALQEPLLQAGWLYHALSASEEEKRGRIEGLFERFLSSYTNRIVTDVADFGEAAFPPPQERSPDVVVQIRELMGLPPTVQPWQIIHALNEFLALERTPGKVVSTGTIFRRDATSTDNTLWICVTAACDLVPREPRRETWEHELHPIRAITALRVRCASSVQKAMKDAEECRHLFFKIDSQPVAVEVVDRSNPLPKLEPFLLDNMGEIRDGRFSAQRLLKSPEGVVELSAMTMQVVGQLREIYANRLLQQAGQHLSRIGVDFVNLPTQAQQV